MCSAVDCPLQSKIHGILAGRELGFSYVRLLPKVYGVRPIVNLARRPLIRLVSLAML